MVGLWAYMKDAGIWGGVQETYPMLIGLPTTKLPTLKYRRLRGDMIEVFKITHNIYDPEVITRAQILS